MTCINSDSEMTDGTAAPLALIKVVVLSRSSSRRLAMICVLLNRMRDRRNSVDAGTTQGCSTYASRTFQLPLVRTTEVTSQNPLDMPVNTWTISRPNGRRRR
jgi:hypothetical protein